MPVHRVAWTSDKVARFWDFLSSRPATTNQYFSQTAGDSVIRSVRQARIPLGGTVVDYGCGPGFFMEKLLRDGVPCSGIESSNLSAEAARQRLNATPGFGGVIHSSGLPTPIESASVDVLFFLETIEHLLEEDFSATLADLHRVIRLGGYVVVTTPNDERLDEAEVMCPDCSAVFHPVQHLRSFTADSLARTMSAAGFSTTLVRATCFTQWPRLDWAVGLTLHLLNRSQPNLLYVGRRIAVA